MRDLFLINTVQDYNPLPLHRYEDYLDMITELGDEDYRKCCVEPILDMCYYKVVAHFDCGEWSPIDDQTGYHNNDRLDDFHTKTVTYFRNKPKDKRVHVELYPDLGKIIVSFIPYLKKYEFFSPQVFKYF